MYLIMFKGVMYPILLYTVLTICLLIGSEKPYS